VSENVQDLLLESLKNGAPSPAMLVRGAATQIAETDDPVLRLLGGYLLAQVDATTETAKVGEQEPPDPELVGDLFVEIEALRHRLGYVAAALGRCDACWGEDPLCSSCHGEGSSGFFWPDRLGFEDLVAPAVARVRQTGRTDQAWMGPAAARPGTTDGRQAGSGASRQPSSTNPSGNEEGEGGGEVGRSDRYPTIPGS
jgi:hypothetical protein